jgi:hypothetical protein
MTIPDSSKPLNRDESDLAVLKVDTPHRELPFFWDKKKGYMINRNHLCRENLLTGGIQESMFWMYWKSFSSLSIIRSP